MRSSGSVTISRPSSETSGPAPSPIASTNWANSGSSALRNGCRRHRIWKSFQSGEDLNDASMTWFLVPPRITGHVCRKSPRRMNILSPNGKSFCLRWDTTARGESEKSNYKERTGGGHGTERKQGSWATVCKGIGGGRSVELAGNKYLLTKYVTFPFTISH